MAHPKNPALLLFLGTLLLADNPQTIREKENHTLPPEKIEPEDSKKIKQRKQEPMPLQFKETKNIILSQKFRSYNRNRYR